jgi:glycine betaine/proline transport system permease protein
MLMQQRNPEFFDQYTLPIGEWVENGVDWLVVNATPLFNAVQWPIEQILDVSEGFLLWLPWYVVILSVIIISFLKTGSKHFRRFAEGDNPGKILKDIFLSGWKLALLTGSFLMLSGFLGYWNLTMTTLSMILTALVFCIVLGIPLGILAASTDTAENLIRPALDAMQTIHPFVYLVPIVMLFGTGPVPGTMATLIFALPPIVRLTNLGIRQVPHEVVEAGRAFGSDNKQLLLDVQLPLALPTIMAGLNQTLMLALSMVVIVALIAGGGLGQEILRSVGRLDIARAVSAGLAVLILAVVLDRISQVGRRSAT